MKVCGQKMEITLPICGRERTFSEQELITILEKHFSNEGTKPKQTTGVAENEQKPKTYDVADTPTEGKFFKVTPKYIDSKLFKKKRKDSRQEGTRQLILEALEELDNNSEKYAESFETLMPEKTWSSKTVNELEELSAKLGGYDGDWVEQALEWAQRISNGESWKKVCNDPDTANWYRMVNWGEGEYKIVGGSCKYDKVKPASYVSSFYCISSDSLRNTVPFVVFRKKK